MGDNSNGELTAATLQPLVAEGLSTRQIAQRLGVGRSRVRAALVRFELATRHDAPPSRPTQLDDPDWLIQRYVTWEWSTSRIARQLGCSPTTVNVALRAHGVEPRTNQQGSFPELLDPTWLRRRYVNDEMSMAAIATVVGSSAASVHRALHRHAIPVRRRPKVRVEIDADWLKVQHHDRQRGLTDIGRELGVTADVVRSACRAHGIDVVHWVTDLDEHWLRQLLTTEQRSVNEVARACGLDRATVRRIANSYGINTTTQARKRRH